MAEVSVRKLIKRFGQFEVVHGIDFDVNDGEFMVLVGPSGCGKSTTLRMIAGLETVSDGEISINGELVNDVPPRDRDIAMVFQDYALYPHMSVKQNLAFGLKMRDTPRVKIEEAVERTADILQIRELLDRKPRQLSGGQRQRVAIGRAIAREPQLFLFDEPLSNLDAKLRVEMRTQIKRLHIAFNATSIYVTHDQTEAMTLADRIVVLRGGVIEQVGTPDQLYNHPVNRFVAGFIGSPTMNFINAELMVSAGEASIVFNDGQTLPLAAAQRQSYANHKGRKVLFGVRPEHLTNVFTAENRSGAGLVPIEIPVEIVEPLGADTLVFSKLGGSEIVSRVAGGADLRPGTKIGVHVDMSRTHLFDPETGVRLTG